MANTNYKCNKCGHLFKGDDLTLECPNCESTSISNIGNSSKSGSGFFTKRNKIIIGIAAIIVLILIMILAGGEDDDKGITEVAEEKYSLSFSTEENYIQIEIKDLNNPSRKVNFRNNKKIYLLLKTGAIQNNENISVDEDKIYPCNEGPVLIKWSNIKQIQRPKNNEKEIDFIFEEGFVKNEKADCKEPLKIEVTQGDSCNIIVYTNYDSIQDSRVLISIDGKNGIYHENKQNYYCKQGKEVIFDTIRVFGFLEGKPDTIAAFQNGEEFMEMGCFYIDPSKTERAIKKYSSNPASIQYLSSFKRLSNNIKIYYQNEYKGVGITGINNIENEMRIQHKDNNVKFRAKITHNSKTKAVSKVNFIKR